MKKLFISVLFFAAFIIQPVFAKSIKVEALSDFSTANPPKYWQIKTVEGFTTKNGYYIKEGSIFEGKIEDVTDPKRLKRNATFRFVPVKLVDIQTGFEYPIKKHFVGKYSFKSDITAKSVIKTGATVVGDQVIGAFVGPGVALVEGVVKNEHDNRAKSAAISVYESTPLSYINKGKEIEIKEGKVFVMSFKTSDDED